MTWQAAAFTILAVGLAAGFAWYERTKPDARLVALVGTMAAFAALGRIAFAPVPNVKPTTDIILIAGFTLGGAPGFVVGAVAGLTSNFFFGQGPWTPWQMAAWGMTGVIGAGVAVLTGRRIGRWPLAVVCGVAGFAFTAVQDVGDWVTYSDHSRAQLGVYVGKGIGFDVVHALACVAFALAFGPALIRSIQRFARRLQVTWLPAGGGTLSVVAVLVCAGLMSAGLAAAPPARAATPEGYLAASQNSDGGLGAARGTPSSQLFSGWAALAFAAQGRNPQVVRNGGQSLTGYIGSQLATASDVGSVERTILVARAAGLSATAFGGRDLVATLLTHVRHNGSVGGLVNLTSFAILALRAAGHPVAPATRAWLLRQQDADGGYNFATAGATSDVDDTGAALEALAAAGTAPATTVRRAVAFIRAQQNRDGGFPSQPGDDPNAQSTAWAVQGLIAVGVSPDGLHRRGAPSPLAYLRSLIAPDGHVRYSRFSDQTPVWVTAQALMALAGKALPLGPVALPAAPSSSPHRGGSGASGHPAAAGTSTASSHTPARLRSQGQTVRRVPAAGRVTPAGWRLAAGPLTVVAAVIRALGLSSEA
ncbi:MAG TPA: prenyltransferase/squalene oxidase repeat-containing protein [Solirubrobacteraceae bacterium]|nr:prenyltransferase/squalene oxidase repeat-containing protein [Solirubrobacteraceae bacterium]